MNLDNIIKKINKVIVKNYLKLIEGILMNLKINNQDNEEKIKEISINEEEENNKDKSEVEGKEKDKISSFVKFIDNSKNYDYYVQNILCLNYHKIH